ncbi:NAD(+) diphosphatase [Geoalkalibacter halelectricus]|uniref:NAD(+) diphosphatase n=1 Tax=Geoalkalibacter halelectricus TaxID=2847045 RepID=A0ABY5ZLE0_9BACT|nr:NAD(+) diphosphatase [Geoalkalibacter halelectricus]MDO3378727.1 NAD(+) diphosphatase [Geoalkalibacter halelectricus]UWZ79965.1 NAD(+) diphosphatase [Geoalkalibacter halelectricus]
MSPLPESYASPLHLPFNATCLGDFTRQPQDADPGGEAGLWLALRGTELLLRESDQGLALPQGPCPLAPGDDTPIYLGRLRNQPLRALHLDRSTPQPAGYVFENLLTNQPRMDIAQLSLGGLAAQALHWEHNSRFCSRCGAATQALPGDGGKKCVSCGYVHYPHIHPCVIVIVRRPGEVLLIRKAIWPEGRYSLVAGFLDFGECLEEAVAREVEEETGVQVTNIRYIGSQGWPFPSQLMAGFVADYTGGEVRVQESELEDARWFPVTALPTLPPKRSIARYLIDKFCH